jgi:hypothetical protein
MISSISVILKQDFQPIDLVFLAEINEFLHTNVIASSGSGIILEAEPVLYPLALHAFCSPRKVGRGIDLKDISNYLTVLDHGFLVLLEYVSLCFG